MPPPAEGGGEDGCGPTDFTVFTVMFTVPVLGVTREATRGRSVLSLVFCDTVVRCHLGGFKNAILSITFVSYVQKCDTVDLESGHVFTFFHTCDTVVLDSHQDFPIFSTFPELRYCGAGMTPDLLLLVSLGPWAAWAAWRAWAAWAASAAWVAWAAWVA